MNCIYWFLIIDLLNIKIKYDNIVYGVNGYWTVSKRKNIECQMGKV